MGPPVAVRQFVPRHAAERLRQHAERTENPAAENLKADLLTAARVLGVPAKGGDD
jgi:hypothetical protein